MNRTLTTFAFVFGTSSVLLVDSAIKGGVILALAACVAVLLRRDSAATRHLVWFVAIVAILIVPVFSALLPQWQVLPAWATISKSLPTTEIPVSAVELPNAYQASLPDRIGPGESDVPSTMGDQPLAAEIFAQQKLDATQENHRIAPESNTMTLSWLSMLPVLWSIGFGLLILRLTAARWMLWSNERRGTVISMSGRPNGIRNTECHKSDRAIVAAFEDAHRQLGVRHQVRLLIHSERTIPVIWGIVRFRLLLPESARQWSGEQLRSVLLHELAHIRRRDTIVQLLAQIACALHWFHPLVWFAAWRLHVERERACDDLVLAQGVRASAYAEHLLNVATKLTVAHWTSACGLAMASHSPLESRLHAILSERLNRRKVSTAIGMIGLLLGASIAIPLAMLRAAATNKPETAEAAMNAEPKDEHSKTLFAQWKTSARTDGTIPGGRIGEMAASLKIFMDMNAGTEAATKCEAVYKKCDASHDWTPDEAVALLDEIETVAHSHAQWTLRINTERLIHRGQPLPEELKDAPWGPPADFLDPSSVAIRGLRMAWLLEPNVRTQPYGTVMESRVLFHNTSRKAVCFATQNWIQSGMHSAKDANGKDITVWAIEQLGRRTRMVFLLAVGEYAEVKGHSIGIGSHEISKEQSAIRAGAWIEAKEGNEITFAPGKLLVSFQTWQNNEGRKDSETVWNEMIAARVAQEGPWPAKMQDRELLLKRVTQDLGIALPTDESIVRLQDDNSPDCLAKLTRRLQEAGKATHFAGVLTAGETKFLVTARGPKGTNANQAEQPTHKDARALFEIWQRHARANGDIPGALIGELAAAVKTFIGYNPTWEGVSKLNAILPRLDASHDWRPSDAIALLHEVAAVEDSPLTGAADKATRSTIRKGTALPKKFADAAWGDAQPNGLRAAWVLEPNAAEHRIGAALKARLLVQNPGQVPVMVNMPTWYQGWVKASDAKGAEVQASGMEWTTIAQLVPVRLGPGEFIEIRVPGVGLGPRAGMGPWAGPRVGSNVLAKADDELTLTHALVPLDGSEVGVREDDPHVTGPGWWLAHIKTRLNRELPLPPDAAERTRLLDRAVRELFATAPTAEETAAFVADQTPGAFDALVKRLAERTDIVSFSGKLPTAPAKFRVLAADANADKQPRVVLGPGVYPLSTGTSESGAATLKIVGRPVGDRRTNDATLMFEAAEFTGKLPPDPHKLEIPDGWGTWAIVCRPNEGFFYLLHKGGVRKIEYSAPRKVTDTPAIDLPVEFRDEVKRQLDIHEIPEAQQAEIFKIAAGPLQQPNQGAKLTTAIEQQLKWGEPVNGLRAALALHPVRDEPEAVDKNDIFLVVQNVSEAKTRLHSSDAAPNPRQLIWREKGVLETITEAAQPLPADFLLQPREVALFRMLLPPATRIPGGRSAGSIIAASIHGDPNFDLTGKMEIATAPAGAWTGTLLSGEIKGGTAIPVISPEEINSSGAAKPRIESAEVDIGKDGELSFNRKRMSLNELKAQAAKNVKKRFTIRADEDVPYAKVIEVVKALKAAGVTELSFAEARVGDGKYRVANRTGIYEFDGKHRFSICRPSELPQWFTVGWPAEGEHPACSLRTFPNVSNKTDGKWAVVWEPGTDVLWWVDDSDVGKMTLTDPARVIVDREGRTNNFSRDFGLPEEVKTEFRRLGFVIGRDKTPGLENTIGGNTGGRSIVSAEAGNWIVAGTIMDADGKPMKDVPVRVTTNQQLNTEKTDEKGNYRVYFSLPIQLLANWRAVKVEPVLDGYTERDMAKAGEFNALVRAGEQPQQVRLADDTDFQPGPIPRFAERDLFPSQPGVSPGNPGRTDFVMLNANAMIRGKVLKPDGNAAAGVQVRVDDGMSTD